jgi:hypothetical protein
MKIIHTKNPRWKNFNAIWVDCFFKCYMQKGLSMTSEEPNKCKLCKELQGKEFIESHIYNLVIDCSVYKGYSKEFIMSTIENYLKTAKKPWYKRIFH